MTPVQLLEAVMLLCFGASWPFSIAKTWRAKRVEGKSGLFLTLILIGYLAGVAAKIVKASLADAAIEAVTGLYAFNAMLVATDLGLFLYYSRSVSQSSSSRSKN